MAKMENSSLVFVLLILLCLQASSGHVEIAEDGTEPPIPAHLSSKMQAKRPLMGFVLDYDYGGHNIKHEHMKGRPGTGGRNP